MAKSVVRKIQIYLNDEQYEYLKREAKRVGSITEAVRRLIDEKLRPDLREDDSIFRLGEKRYSSKKGDLSTKHDEYLYGKTK